MGRVVLRPPTVADCANLAPRLREADRLEALASSGPDLVRTLHRALYVSSHRWAVEVDGELACLFGFAPVCLIEGKASIWMLGAPILERVPGALTKTTLKHIGLVRGVYPYLENHVDARNTKSIRWLKRIGFLFDAHPVPWGLAQLPFYRFYRET